MKSRNKEGRIRCRKKGDGRRWLGRRRMENKKEHSRTNDKREIVIDGYRQKNQEKWRQKKWKKIRSVSQ